MLCSFVDESFLFEVTDNEEIEEKNKTNETRIFLHPLNNKRIIIKV